MRGILVSIMLVMTAALGGGLGGGAARGDSVALANMKTMGERIVLQLDTPSTDAGLWYVLKRQSDQSYLLDTPALDLSIPANFPSVLCTQGTMKHNAGLLAWDGYGVAGDSGYTIHSWVTSGLVPEPGCLAGVAAIGMLLIRPARAGSGPGRRNKFCPSRMHR